MEDYISRAELTPEQAEVLRGLADDLELITIEKHDAVRRSHQ